MSKPIVVEENGRKFTLLVKSGLKTEKLRIDNNVIKCQKTKKCDWAIKVDEKNGAEIFFIELKGCDLGQAIDQLESTIVNLNTLHQPFKTKQAHAVCTKIIPSFVSSAQVRAYSIKKKYGFILKWHSQCATVRSAAQ